MNIHFCADARMINNSGIGVYIQHTLAEVLTNSTYTLTLLGRRAELAAYFDSGTYRHIEADFPIYSWQEQAYLPLLIPVCDIFWSPHFNVPIGFIRAGKRVATIHDVYHLAFPKSFSLMKRSLAKLLFRQAYSRSNLLLTVSEFSAEEIRTRIGRAATIRVIYNGIDHQLFRPVTSAVIQQHVRERYGLPNQFVLFVGNVKPNKNIRALVLAFKLLLNNLPDHYLLIVGKKEGFITGDHELFRQIGTDPRLNERVVFTGYVATDDLPVLYSLASVFAFPSLYEGFGFPPLEAMACGCPVVASDRASIPEICGQAALYVNPDDSERFADELYRVITNAYVRSLLVKQGYEQAATYDWKKAGQEFMEAINALIGSGWRGETGI